MLSGLVMSVLMAQACWPKRFLNAALWGSTCHPDGYPPAPGCHPALATASACCCPSNARTAGNNGHAAGQIEQIFPHTIYLANSINFPCRQRLFGSQRHAQAESSLPHADQRDWGSLAQGSPRITRQGGKNFTSSRNIWLRWKSLKDEASTCCPAGRTHPLTELARSTRILPLSPMTSQAAARQALKVILVQADWERTDHPRQSPSRSRRYLPHRLRGGSGDLRARTRAGADQKASRDNPSRGSGRGSRLHPDPAWKHTSGGSPHSYASRAGTHRSLPARIKSDRLSFPATSTWRRCRQGWKRIW